MAQVYKYTEEKVREWPVPAGTLKRSPVLSISNEPGFTLGPRSDSTVTFGPNVDGVTITQPNGLVGQTAGSASVATDGTWSYPVTGATSATPKNTLVYAVVSGGAVTSLTLTVGSNVKFGVVDSFLGKASAQDTAVKIGVFA